MPVLEITSVLGNVLDPIFGAALRVLIRAIGCEVNCSDGESVFRLLVIFILLISIGVFVYIFASKHRSKKKRRGKRRS